jgi:drug/metabolite transporter (DMT)-like permease
MATQPWAITLYAVASIFSALATFFIKLAAPRMSLRIAKLIRNRQLITGLCFYAFSSLIALIALRGGELSILYPIIALQYVWTNILSMKYLKEKVGLLRWAGIALIFLGVSLIGIGA